MPSKEFLAFQCNVPTAPPTADGSPMPQQGGPNAYPGPNDSGNMPPMPGGMGDYGVPTVPPDYVPPEPVIPEGVEGGKITVGGVPGLHIKVPGVREKCALLYLHGGGFTIGSAMTAGPLLKLFGEKAGLEGYAVEYGLAPYHPFPEALNECVAFYKGLLEAGYEKIVIGGESAGAGLTLSVALALKEQGLPMPAVLWCSSPIDDIVLTRQPLYSVDFFCDSSEKILNVYCPGQDGKNPLISPLYGDFTGMPPMIIQVGGGESLAAGGVRLAEKAARANVEVVLHFGQDMPHTFAMDYEHYPEAAFAMDEIIRFVGSRLEIQ